MIKLAIISFVFAAALAAPTAETGVRTGKLQTPASTAKLTPLVPSLISPVAHIPYVSAPVVPQVSPYAYTYQAPVAPVAFVPGSYSIEQHGYNIAY